MNEKLKYREKQTNGNRDIHEIKERESERERDREREREGGREKDGQLARDYNTHTCIVAESELIYTEKESNLRTSLNRVTDI